MPEDYKSGKFEDRFVLPEKEFPKSMRGNQGWRKEPLQLLEMRKMMNVMDEKWQYIADQGAPIERRAHHLASRVEAPLGGLTEITHEAKQSMEYAKPDLTKLIR